MTNTCPIILKNEKEKKKRIIANELVHQMISYKEMHEFIFFVNNSSITQCDSHLLYYLHIITQKIYVKTSLFQSYWILGNYTFRLLFGTKYPLQQYPKWEQICLPPLTNFTSNILAGIKYNNLIIKYKIILFHV